MRLTGKWRIVEMDLWDVEAIDLLGEGFIEFGKDGTGAFRSIAVQGSMDCRFSEREGRPSVEFTWDGDDDGHPANGRGWAGLDEDGLMHGRIYFHLGDDSGFRAVPAEDQLRGDEDRASHRDGARGRGLARS